MPCRKIYLLVICCVCGLFGKAQETFTNPLLPSGADPFSFFKDGYYYYTHTTANSVVLYKTKDVTDLKNAENKVIYRPPQGTEYSRNLWAPEIHFLNGKWYAYFAADNGTNETHRMYVLENASADPLQGEWTFKGKVGDDTNRWAIDGDVFNWNDKLYMIWSGWEGEKNGQQNIYIAAMENPWTISGKRTMISAPRYEWEKFGDLKSGDTTRVVLVNEGPQFLRNGKHLFIVYSASGCWTDNYRLGLLQYKGKGSLLDAANWTKHPDPIFTPSAESGVYSPGHNSFFKSPDGKEDWILYHANSKPAQGCGRFRSPRAQRFTWNTDGTPNFGAPVKENEAVAKPSGTK